MVKTLVMKLILLNQDLIADGIGCKVYGDYMIKEDMIEQLTYFLKIGLVDFGGKGKDSFS